MIDHAIFRLAGTAVGPRGLDAQQVARDGIEQVMDTVVVRVKYSGRSRGNETEKAVAAGRCLGKTEDGAAVRAAGDAYDQ